LARNVQSLPIMTEAQLLAERINSLRPRLKEGTLRFWGEWFGRPYDNLHCIVDCEADLDLLRLRFDGDEVLCVWAPRVATIDHQTFRIMDAARVRWEWFCYGRSKIEANRYHVDFARGANDITASTNVDWYTPELKPDSQQPAVEIL
jgi:hypothetical protein